VCVKTKLRAMIQSDELLLLPGVYDGLSAKVVAQAGYTAAFITGSGISESHLGRPDVGIMGLNENVTVCRNIVSSTELIYLADGDTGYGNAMNAYFTVKAFESTGVAGVMLEDQKWPKRCGHMEGKEVITSEEMVEKIRAASDAKQDQNFVITARTDSAKTHGLAEAISRSNEYFHAGADLLFADALLSKEDIQIFTQNVEGPVMVNMGFGLRERNTTPLCSPSELKKIGVSVAIYPRMLTSSAVQGMKNALDAFDLVTKEEQVYTDPKLQVSFEELHNILDLNEILELQKKYGSTKK
jgi:2-methylisocitrate lyase-like PEP mutase family enzyme